MLLRTCAVVMASLPLVGCGLIGKKDNAADAGAAAAAPASAASTAAGSTTPASAGKGKPLDATDCNPGTSLNPVDKGKTIQSDHFKYTLLDVRTDTVDNAFAKVKSVILVKLQIENITNKPQLNTSVADVDLTRDKPGADRVKEKNLHYQVDFFYSRTKMCVDLGADVKPGTLPPGGKAIGYYVYGDSGAARQSLWFDARNVSPEAVSKGTLLKVVGSFRIQ